MAAQRWSRDVVTREILSLVRNGRDLRHSEVCATNQRLVSAAVRYFGSWGAAVAAAGVDYTHIRRESQIARSDKVTKWSRDRIAQELKRLVESGECLAAATARSNHPALFSAAVSPRYYGSWRAALTSLGVDYDSILNNNRSSSAGARDLRGMRTVIRRMRVMSAETKRLSGTQARAKYPKLYDRVIDQFGTWEAAVSAAFEQEPPHADRKMPVIRADG